MIWKGGLLLVSKEENGEWRMEREKIIEKFQENYQTKSELREKSATKQETID